MKKGLGRPFIFCVSRLLWGFLYIERWFDKKKSSMMEHEVLLTVPVIEGKRFVQPQLVASILGGFYDRDDVKYDVNVMPKPGSLLVGFIFQHLFIRLGRQCLNCRFWFGIDPAIACSPSGLGTLAHLTSDDIDSCLHGVQFCLYCCYADVDED